MAASNCLPKPGGGNEVSQDDLVLLAILFLNVCFLSLGSRATAFPLTVEATVEALFPGVLSFTVPSLGLQCSLCLLGDGKMTVTAT